MQRVIPRWIVLWRHAAGALVVLLAGAGLVACVGLLVQIALDPVSPGWHGAGPAALGSALISPFCLAVMYLEWQVFVRRDAGAARFLGGAGLLLAAGLLFSLGLGALGLLGVGSPSPDYATWPAVGWTGGVAASAAFLGGVHWVWARRVRRTLAGVSDMTAKQGTTPDGGRDASLP